MKTVRISADYCIGDAGGEGSRYVKGNIVKVDDDTAAILIGAAAAEEIQEV